MRTDLPGWRTIIDEISNGVFKVILIDNDGRKAEIIDIEIINNADTSINNLVRNLFRIFDTILLFLRIL